MTNDVKKYESEKQAYETLNLLKIEMMNKKCPVFGHTCFGNGCISFNEGRIRTKNPIMVSEPYCGSPLITGIIEHCD